MTSPKHATDTESGRFYTDLPGFENLTLGSVTNIVGIKTKPALQPWSAKLAAVRAMEHEETWHAIQQEEGDEAARKWISRASRDETAHKAAIGSAVHHACETFPDFNEEHILGVLAPSLDLGYDAHSLLASVGAHVEQYGRFLRDHEVNIVERERTVFSPRDGWAGTLDLIVEIPTDDGALRRYVGDIKTGGIYPDSNALQLAAYRHAEYMVRGNASVPFEHHIDGGFVLQLKPRSYKVFWTRCDYPVYRYFLAARDLWLWTNEHAKAVIGDVWR